MLYIINFIGCGTLCLNCVNNKDNCTQCKDIMTDNIPRCSPCSDIAEYWDYGE